MKNAALISLAVFLLISLPAAVAQTGNGAPNGGHFNLNLIGQEKCKSADMMGSDRHSIFVLLNYSDATPTNPTPLINLDRRNKIFLSEGPFQVIDGNACDGAEFQLPQNECSTTLDPTDLSGCDYQVFIRGLGSPKNDPYAEMTTCRIDTDLGEYQCSTETVTVDRHKGKSTFTNVTKQLTTLCLDIGVADTSGALIYDGKCDTRVLLFEKDFYQYFWDYDNHGLRLAQLRFYPRVIE